MVGNFFLTLCPPPLPISNVCRWLCNLHDSTVSLCLILSNGKTAVEKCQISYREEIIEIILKKITKMRNTMKILNYVHKQKGA